MKILRTLVVITAATFGSYAYAADLPVAVVDMQRVLQESKAALNIRDQIKQKRDDFQNEISKQEDSLRTEEKKLTDQRSLLSQEAFDAKRDAFKAKVVDVQRDVQVKRAQLDNALQTALGDVQKVMLEIVSDLAKAKGFKMAIPSSQVLFATPDMDITKDVLDQLNKKLPAVPVKIEKLAQPEQPAAPVAKAPAAKTPAVSKP